MGRNTIADKKPLLDDAEQNIGNSSIIPPQGGAPTIVPQTNPARIIELSAGSAAGQTTSIIMTASRIAGPDNPFSGFPGPITGVIEFGNGGRFTKVEFDVPTGPYVGTIPPGGISNAVEPQDGGVIITVPTGVLRVYARYDDQLLAPCLNHTPPVPWAVDRGVTVVGPGGQPSEPVLVKAMVGYFSKSRSKVYKTVYCYIGANGVAPVAIAASYCLPAHAKTVKVLRFPLSSVIDVGLSDGVRTIDTFSTPANASAPEVDVIGHETVVSLISHGGGDTITFLALVCEIGI
jgi:hypothetical protein